MDGSLDTVLEIIVYNQSGVLYTTDELFPFESLIRNCNFSHLSEISSMSQ